LLVKTLLQQMNGEIPESTILRTEIVVRDT